MSINYDNQKIKKQRLKLNPSKQEVANYIKVKLKHIDAIENKRIEEFQSMNQFKKLLLEYIDFLNLKSSDIVYAEINSRTKVNPKDLDAKKTYSSSLLFLMIGIMLMIIFLGNRGITFLHLS
jgi:cytoskeletal protein RodZ